MLSRLSRFRAVRLTASICRILLCTGLMTLPVVSQAQLGYGARALGMGGAYTAVADDIYAAYWNPAGIALLRGVHASLPSVAARLRGPVTADTLINHFPSSTASQIAFARRAGTGVSQADVNGSVAVAGGGFALTFQSFATGSVIPRNAGGGIGFHYLNFLGQRVPEPDSQADINASVAFQTVATYATRTDRNTFAGVNLKITNFQPTNINIRFNGTNANIPVTTTTGRTVLGASFDAGVLHRVTSQVTVGATLRDFIRPDVRQFGADVAPTRLALGAAYHDRKNGLLAAADIDEIGGETHLNLGLEYSASRYFQLRGGLYKGRPTVGVGIGRFVNLAYSPDESMIGFSLGF